MLLAHAYLLHKKCSSSSVQAQKTFLPHYVLHRPRNKIYFALSLKQSVIECPPFRRFRLESTVLKGDYLLFFQVDSIFFKKIATGKDSTFNVRDDQMGTIMKFVLEYLQITKTIV